MSTPLRSATATERGSGEAYEAAERLLVRAKLLAEQANELAAARRGNAAPGEKGVVGAADRFGHRGSVAGGNAADLLPVDRRAGGEVALGRRRHAEAIEEAPRLFGG